MAISNDDAVTAAVAIVNAEIAKVNRRSVLGCAVASILLASSPFLLLLGVAGAVPLAFAGGIATFGAGLAVGEHVPKHLDVDD